MLRKKSISWQEMYRTTQCINNHQHMGYTPTIRLTFISHIYKLLNMKFFANSMLYQR